MAARTRTRTLLGPRTPGTSTSTNRTTGAVFNGTDSTGTQDRSTQTTADVTSDTPPPWTIPHRFHSVVKEAIPPVINGTYYYAPLNQDRVLNNYSNSRYDGHPDISWAYDSGIPTMTTLGIKAIANMNPNTPDVDLPLFLFELKDLPRLIKYVGDSIVLRRPIGGVSGGVVGLNLGLAPLISDVRKLMDLASLIEKRQNYLRQLASGARIRRKLGKGTGTEEYTVDVLPSITGITLGLHTKRPWNAWYTAQISADFTIPQLENLHGEAVKATLGLQGVSMSTVWNMLPWTWLIDYFFSFGSFLEACRGQIPFKFKNVCVMRKIDAVRTLEQVSNLYGLDFQPGRQLITAKQREVYQTTPIFGLKMKVLTGTQIETLGALAMTRDKRVLALARNL